MKFILLYFILPLGIFFSSIYIKPFLLKEFKQYINQENYKIRENILFKQFKDSFFGVQNCQILNKDNIANMNLWKEIFFIENTPLNTENPNLSPHCLKMMTQNDQYGNSPISLAVTFNYIDRVQLLIQYNFDVNHIGSYHQNLLHYASYRGNSDMIKLLSENTNLDLSQQDEDGNTPLHILLDHHYYKAARYLIQLGAKLHIMNKNGITPMDLIHLSLNHNKHSELQNIPILLTLGSKYWFLRKSQITFIALKKIKVP